MNFWALAVVSGVNQASEFNEGDGSGPRPATLTAELFLPRKRPLFYEARAEYGTGQK